MWIYSAELQCYYLTKNAAKSVKNIRQNIDVRFLLDLSRITNFGVSTILSKKIFFNKHDNVTTIVLKLGFSKLAYA